MNGQKFSQSMKFTLLGSSAFQSATGFWLALAVVGQWVFSVYLALYYGSSVVNNQLHRLKEKLTDYPDLLLFLLNVLNM